MESKPTKANKEYFTSETFPEIIGFCEKDPYTHVFTGEEESYEYKLNGKKAYLLKNREHRWEIVSFTKDQIVRVSTNATLGLVLSQALTYVHSEYDKQEERVSILIPVNKTDSDKALALMYLLGGYPANFLQMRI